MKKIAFIAAALMAAGVAQAQTNASPFYVDAGYVFLNLDDNAGSKPSLGAIRGFAGWDLHKNLGVELMLAGGTADGTTEDGSKVKLKSAYGVFAKPKLALHEQLEVFGRLGWVKAKTRFSDATGSVSDSDSDLAWGIGATYKFTPNWSASLDYTSYYDKNSIRIDGIGLSVGYRF